MILKPGSYAYGPAKLAHTAVCTKDAACVLFIATELPFDEVTDLAHMDADRDARVSLAEFQDRFYDFDAMDRNHDQRSEEHTSELQSLMRISYAVFCLKKQKIKK